MPIVCSDFIDVARDCIVSEEASEAMCRMSVSRAYYGAYHAALGYADAISIPPVSDTGGRTHEKLRLFYEKFFGDDRALTLRHRQIGYRLKQFHDSRVIADYKIEETVSYMLASSQLERCSALMDCIASLSSTRAA